MAHFGHQFATLALKQRNINVLSHTGVRQRQQRRNCVWVLTQMRFKTPICKSPSLTFEPRNNAIRMLMSHARHEYFWEIYSLSGGHYLACWYIRRTVITARSTGKLHALDTSLVAKLSCLHCDHFFICIMCLKDVCVIPRPHAGWCWWNECMVGVLCSKSNLMCWGCDISMQVFFNGLPALMLPAGLNFQISLT